MTIQATRADAILDLLLGGQALAADTTLYVALFTGNPGTTGSAASEVSGGSYNRVGITNNLTNWPAASAASKANGAAFTFPTATGSWGTVTYFGFCLSGTPGTNNVIYSAALTTSEAIGSGDTAVFPIGSITASIA